jgi:colanic acid biosynthesis glycosyl transferase WcaI
VRVVFVNRYFAPDESATSQLASDLAQALVDRGIEVEAVTSRQLYGFPKAKLKARETIGGVKLVRVLTSRFGMGSLVGRSIDYLSFYVSVSLCLAKRLRAGDVVIAMTDPPLLSIPCAAIARFKRARLINWLQDLFPEVAERLAGNRVPLFWRLLRRMRDASLGRAAANVVIGERMAECVRSASDQRVRVVPNWALVEGDVDSSPLRAALGLEGKFVICYSGNMGWAHQLDRLIDAAVVLREHRDIRFLLVGDGVRKNALEARVHSLGLRNVQFRPYQARGLLQQSLSVADLHVASLDPALEGLIVPSKFVGAIAVGRPVLWFGDPDGEVGRMIRSANCGLAAGESTAEALAGELESLAQDGTRIARMREAASELHGKAFSREVILGRWHGLIAKVSVDGHP